MAGWSRTLPAAAQEVLVECFCKIEAPQESLISYAGPKVRKGSCVTSITGPNGGAELYER